jgi:hypothetical protein
MTEPKPLSDAAVDVLCAAQDADVEPTTSLATISAAALRTAVGWVLPDAEPAGLSASRDECLAGVIRAEVRRKFLAIAAELQGPL